MAVNRCAWMDFNRKCPSPRLVGKGSSGTVMDRFNPPVFYQRQESGAHPSAWSADLAMTPSMVVNVPGCVKLPPDKAVVSGEWIVVRGQRFATHPLLLTTVHYPLTTGFLEPTLAATILDGNEIRDEIQAELLQQIGELKARGITPGLAAVLVGENPASQIYVRSKVKSCETLGLYSERIERSKEATTEELLALVDDLNHNEKIDGILIQLPLPPQVDTKRVLMAVDPAKDVDGFHPINVGNLVAGRTGFVPCTPAGILEILNRSHIPLKGARAVVIGRSDIVGKPVAMLLLHEHCTVTICHSRTRDLPGVAREADILVAAMGKAAFVTADFIKPGGTVVDVGINRLTTEEEVRKIFHDPTVPLATLAKRGAVLVGDVQPEDARAIAGAFTPVPGGVGPLTIVMLMSNTIQAARRRRSGSGE